MKDREHNGWRYMSEMNVVTKRKVYGITVYAMRITYVDICLLLLAISLFTSYNHAHNSLCHPILRHDRQQVLQ